MRQATLSFGLLALTLGSLSLGACNPTSPVADVGGHGRYTGVGIYGPGKQWTRMAALANPKDDKQAQPIDDQAIIVVSDSQTGELRACGDLTGYCIGFNPWKQPLSNAQQTPIVLTAHVKSDDPAMTVEVGSAPRHKRRAGPKPSPPPQA